MKHTFDSRKTKKFPEIDEENVRWYPIKVYDFNRKDKEIIKKHWSIFQPSPTALYINIPFCPYFCNYCVFVKYPFYFSIANKYISALEKELSLYEDKIQKVTSVWIGGGTPTLLPPQLLTSLLHNVQEFTTEKTEIVIEAEPTTLSTEVVDFLRKSNITTVSLGVQTFSDDILKILGRKYTSEFVSRKIQELKEASIKINVDIMYGLPHQQLQDVDKEIESLLQLNLEHISIFRLMVFENTILGKLIQEGKVAVPSIKISVDMYLKYRKELLLKDYSQYSVYYFSKPKNEITYHIDRFLAPQKYVLGIGCGSVGFFNNTLIFNTPNLKDYLRNIRNQEFPIRKYRIANKEDLMRRYFIFGVKMITVDLKPFKKLFQIDPHEKFFSEFDFLERNSLARVGKNKLSLTPKGMIYINNISKLFFSPNEKGKQIIPSLDLEGGRKYE